MPRYKLTIEYDGTNTLGWQRQQEGITIQGVLEDAIVKFCGETVEVVGAGRTDAGVHAIAQVAHVDFAEEHDIERIQGAINFHLKPHLVSVLKVESVTDDFHARFSAVERGYVYKIINRRPRLALHHGHYWQVPLPLDVSAMQQAADLLIGEHDFTTFRDSECQAKHAVRTLDEVTLKQDGEQILIYVRAQSFLHHMVRNITGTLAQVGLGKWNVQDVATALNAKDRTKGGPTAPAHGLYLTHVKYE